MIYQRTYSKVNRAYYWCDIKEDGSLVFGFDDGDNNKVTLSINSYSNTKNYYRDAKKKLDFYKKLYPSYYKRICSLGSYITNGNETNIV